MQQSNGGGKGALFGVIIIIILLIAGGLYLGFRNTQSGAVPTSTTATTTVATTTYSGAMDQTAAIEAGLSDSSLESLDDDAADINAALAI